MGAGVEIATGGQSRQFQVIIKNEIRQVNIPGILEETGKDKDHWLLVAQYIPQPLKEELNKMADRAGIALANIGQLLEELEQAGFLGKKEDGHRLKNKAQLFQRWAELYPIILKPKLILGKFRFLHEADRKRWKAMTPRHFRWGGEPAGAIYTGYLEPECFTIYIKGPVTELVKLFKIVPDPEGDIEVVEEFWKTEEEEETDQFMTAGTRKRLYE
jgi:hypothetical protein